MIVNKRLFDNSRYLLCLAIMSRYNVIAKTLQNMVILSIFILYIGQLLIFTDSTVHLYLFINMITNYNYSVDSIFKSDLGITYYKKIIVYIYRILGRQVLKIQTCTVRLVGLALILGF